MISLILGPMYAGKSTELTKRIRRAKQRGYAPLVVKHVWDTRYSEDGRIVTHDKEGQYDALGVKSIEDVREAMVSSPGVPNPIGGNRLQWLFVDEAQFITGDWATFCMEAASAGWNITLAALNADWKQKVYPEIAAIVADEIKTLKAVCKKCQGDAVWSKCLFPYQLQQGILIGGAESWEARCRRCFDVN